MGLGVLLIIVVFVIVYKAYGPAAVALQLALISILTDTASSLMKIGLHIFVHGMGYGSKMEDKIIHPE